MRIDAVTLEVFNHRLSALAEEMGVALCRSAFSPNIKERRDFSCAVFDGRGNMVAQAAHIPVHLGSTPLSVRAAIERVPMQPGDVVVLNDPYAGGTHLPDVTVVAPVYLRRERAPFAYVANRAHHADIGGSSPGSMPLATEIYQEGFRLPPVRIVARGRVVSEVLDLFLANTRVADERRGDLLAQLAALRLGGRRLREIVQRSGRRLTQRAMSALQDYSARLMSTALRRLPAGVYRAEDWMDDDGAGALRVPIRVSVRIAHGRAVVDFSGTAAQVAGGINANHAVTVAAVLYVFQGLAGTDIPANAGLLRPVQIIAPPGTVVNANFPAAVAGGNVETAQRIVDVLLKALAPAAPRQIPAASCGSMNNLAVGGHDPFRGRDFAYYETIAGGAGAGPRRAGASGVHTHMTNTLNTPVEALEATYPLRITHYSLRRASGGTGAHRGGDGIVREIEFLASAQTTVLSERRRLRPYGQCGGGPGSSGQNLLITAHTTRRLSSKVTLNVSPGDRLRMLTPGGGGWGRRRRATPPRGS
ncbi:MAG TPA: hydantoinase B/oxoprolinase family protein [Candidatus Margulisiibacteriota bacterium]|nr:hydantoinase B/oxoprolinase family protein [Candidatus Margulisiibacteriota bacterium]